MSEQNKQIARRFIAAFMANDAATLTQVVAADVADHSRPPGQPPTDRQALLDAVAAFKQGFPDLDTTIDREVVDSDMVVQYGVMTGTHSGNLMGIPPTGKAVSILWMDMHRIQGGQIVESWHLEDIAGMLQLGVTPSAGRLGLRHRTPCPVHEPRSG